MWCEKSGCKRAQISSGELLVAYFIFFLVLTLVITRWSETIKGIEESEDLYNLESVSVDIAEKLVRTRGVPSGWGIENVSVIGLAEEPRVLSPEKVLIFLDMMNDSAFNNPPCNDPTISNYECNKPILGIRKYDFYFTLRDINGSIIEIENKSGLTGREPPEDTEGLAVTRTAILNEEIVKVILILWYWG